jgi:hypothetical protein
VTEINFNVSTESFGVIMIENGEEIRTNNVSEIYDLRHETKIERKEVSWTKESQLLTKWTNVLKTLFIPKIIASKNYGIKMLKVSLSMHSDTEFTWNSF